MKFSRMVFMDATSSFPWGLCVISLGLMAACVSSPSDLGSGSEDENEPRTLEMNVPYEEPPAAVSLQDRDLLRRSESPFAATDRTVRKGVNKAWKERSSRAHAAIEAFEWIRLGKLEHARKILENIVETDAFTPYLQLIRILLSPPQRELGRLEEALKQAHAAFVRVGKSLPPQERIEFLYLYEVVSAFVLFRWGENERALKHIHNAHSHLEEREEHGLLLTQHYVEKQQWGLANATMERVFSNREDNSVQAHLMWHEILLQVGQPEKAASLLARAQSLYPGSPKIRFYSAQQLISAGRVVEGCDLLSELFERNQSGNQLVFHHALCLDRRGSNKDAIYVLEKAKMSFGGSSELQALLAHFYLKSGRAGDARQAAIGAEVTNQHEFDRQHLLDHLLRN